MHYHLRRNKTLGGLMFDLGPQQTFIRAWQVPIHLLFSREKDFPCLKQMIFILFHIGRVELRNSSYFAFFSASCTVCVCLSVLVSKESWDVAADVKAQPFVSFSVQWLAQCPGNLFPWQPSWMAYLPFPVYSVRVCVCSCECACMPVGGRAQRTIPIDERGKKEVFVRCYERLRRKQCR